MKNGTTYFCYSTNAFPLGGAESYGIRLFEEMYHKGLSNVLILWRGEYIDPKWKKEFTRLKVQIAYISPENPLSVPRKESGEKFIFAKGSRVIVVAVTPHSYLNALYISRKYWKVTFRCIFYQLLEKAFDGIFLNENWRKLYTTVFMRKLVIPENFFMVISDCGEYVNQTYQVGFKGKLLPIGMKLRDLDMEVVKNRLLHDEFTILSVSRMSGDAKFYMLGLMDAYASLKEKRKDIKLVLVGDGEHMQMYKDKAASYGEEVSKDIIFAGNVSYLELQSYFEQASVMVGMGTAVLDAAMTGLISVLAGAYATGENAQGYFHETASIAWMVREDDPIFPMEDAINRVCMMDSEEYVKCSVESYQMLQEVYDIKRAVKLFLNKSYSARPKRVYVLGLGIMEWIGKKYVV